MEEALAEVDDEHRESGYHLRLVQAIEEVMKTRMTEHYFTSKPTSEHKVFQFTAV